MRLLVIEDETALSEVIRAAFTDEKFEVDLAEDERQDIFSEAAVCMMLSYWMECSRKWMVMMC